MVQAQPQLKTFDDFLTHAETVDGYYELTYGELVEVSPESYDNLRRALKLYDAFKALVEVKQVCPQGLVETSIRSRIAPKNPSFNLIETVLALPLE